MLLLLLLMLGLLREHIPHDCRLRVQRTDHSSGDAHVAFAALAAGPTMRRPPCWGVTDNET